MTAEEILTDIRTMLTEIIGVEYTLSLDIDMNTSFDADLELESIEFVKLSVMLAEHYGDRIDFVNFLADKTLNEIIALQVGDVVNYIAGNLTPAGALDG